MSVIDSIIGVLGKITWQQWLVIGGAILALAQVVVPIIMG